jgi:hypothetical protein
MPRGKKKISEPVTDSPMEKEPTREIAEPKKAKVKVPKWKDEPPKYEAHFGKFLVKFD